MKHPWFIAIVLWPLLAQAQVAPVVGSTVKSTSTAATSMCVGCPLGSTTPANNSVITVATVVLKDTTAPSVVTNKIYTTAGIIYWAGGATLSASVTGINALAVGNTTAGTTNRAQLRASSDTVNTELDSTSSTYSSSGTLVQSAGLLQTDGSGGLSIAASNAAGVLRFYAGGSAIRWGINAAGDWTFGTAAHIADSNGTPTAGAGASAVFGQDYALVIQVTGTPTTVTANFGHTWTTTPVCMASRVGGPASSVAVAVSPSTTAVTVTLPSGNFVNLESVSVLCRSY
jgi:hypothetical protein